MDIILDIFNRETGKNLGVEDLTVYDVGECYGLNKEEAAAIWEKCHKEMITRSLPIWDLQEFMNGWITYKKEGRDRNQIIIVTAREEKYREETESWLKRNKVQYDEIYFGYNKKMDAVREHSLDVLVDDKASNIQDIDRNPHLGCEGFVADQPYNRWYGTRNRVFTGGVLN